MHLSKQPTGLKLTFMLGEQTIYEATIADLAGGKELLLD